MNKQRRRKNRRGMNVSRQRWASNKRRVSRNLRAEPLEDRRLLTALAGDMDMDYNARHNYMIAEDVNSDWHVSPADALSVINDINTYGSRILSRDASVSQHASLQSLDDGAGTSSVQKVDTNNDGAVSPIDALMIIDRLNAEGEEDGIPKLVAISLEAQQVDADGNRVLDDNGDPIPIDRVKSGDNFALGVTVQDLRSNGDGVAAVYFDIGYSNDLVESPNLETESDALTELFTVGGVDPSSFEDPQLFEDQWIPTEAYEDAFSANPWRYWDADSGMWTDTDGDMVPDEFDEMGGATFFEQFGTDVMPVMHGILTADLRFDDPGTVTFTGNPAELSPVHDVVAFPVENVDPRAIQFNSVDVTIFKPVYARDDTVATLEDTPATISYMGDMADNELDAGWKADNPSAALALDSYTQPANGQVVDDEDGTFTYTPDENYNNDSGTPDSFTYTMTDGLGNTDSATVTITVEAVNDPPTASANTVTTDEDEAYVFSASDFNFSDVDVGDTLAAVRITSLPTAGSLMLNGADVTVDQEIARSDIDAGNLTFMPGPDENGDDYATFQFRVGDGMAFSVADYPMTIDVTPVQDAPTAAPGTVTTLEDTPHVFVASDFNFSDVDEGDTLQTVRITSLPTTGSLEFDGGDVTVNQVVSRADIDAGKLTFTPDPDENGDDYATFRFKVSDGTDFSVDEHPMTIDVTPVNDPPIPSTEDFVAIERLKADDPPSELFVLDGAKPGPPDETEEIFIHEIVDQPELGTLEIGPDKKVLIYTPDVGEVGETDTFQYTLIDEFDEVSDVATGSVFIEPLVRPYARDDSVEVNEDEDIVIDVQANDLFNEGDDIEREFHLVESIDGDDITTTAGPLATEHGTVTIVNGEVEYTPNPDYFGPDTFQYVIDDDFVDDGDPSEPSIGTVSIDVLPVNDPPTAQDVAFEGIQEDSEDNLLDVMSNDLVGNPGDPVGEENAGDFITLMPDGLGTPDQGGSVAIVGNEISYTPAADFFGTETFTYTIVDSGDLTDTATVTVTVDNVNDPPTARDVEFEGIQEDSENNLLDVMSNDLVGNPGDPVGEENADPADSITLVPSGLGTPDQGGSVAIAGDEIRYTPAADFFGTETFTYTIEDSHGETDTATVTVTVDNVNDPPTAQDVTFEGIQEDSEDNLLDVMSNDFVGHPDDPVGEENADPPDSITLVPGGLGTPDQEGSVAIVEGKISYTPAPDFFGTETFTYTIVDSGELTDTATVTVEVEPVNDPPIPAETALTATERRLEEDPETILNVLDGALPGPPNESDQSVSLPENAIVTGTQFGTLEQDGNQLVYTPNEGVLAPAQDTFVYRIVDSAGGETEATGVIDIVPFNRPYARDDEFSVEEDTDLVMDVQSDLLDNDLRNTGFELQFTLIGGVQNGNLDFNENDGVITYTPNDDFFGEDSFEYEIDDAFVDDGDPSEPSIGTVWIDVLPVNDPPTAQDVAFEDIQEDSEDNRLDVMSNDLVGNVDDPVGEENAGDFITLVPGGLGTPDQGGSVAIVGDEISYTPAPDFFGIETFEYTIEDSHGETDTATVTVEVDNVNDPPTAIDTIFPNILEDSVDNPLNVMLGDFEGRPNAKDGPEDFIELVNVEDPNKGGTATIDGDVVLYTPAPDFFGTETFVYTIQDSHGETDSATVTVFVENVNDPPPVINEDGVEDDRLMALKDFEDQELDVLANEREADNPDGDETLTLTELIGEDGGGNEVRGTTDVPTKHGTVSISADGMKVIYTPNPGFETEEGEFDSFGYVVRDDSGAENDTAEARAEIDVIDAVPSDISGVVYIDANGDGIQQSDELTLAGVEVTLSGTNIRDAAVDWTVKTDANGEFVFSGVLPTAENSESGYSITAEQPNFLEDRDETIVDSAIDDDYDPGQVHNDHFSNIKLGVWGTNGRSSGNYTFGEGGLEAEYINKTQFLSSFDPTMMFATDGEGDTFWFSVMKGWEGVKSVSFQFDDISTSEGLASGQLTVTDTNDVEHTRSLSYYQHYDFSGDPQDAGVVMFLKGSAADFGFDLSANEPSAQAEGEMAIEDEDLELLAAGDTAEYQEAVDAVFSDGQWA